MKTRRVTVIFIVLLSVMALTLSGCKNHGKECKKADSSNVEVEKKSFKKIFGH